MKESMLSVDFSECPFSTRSCRQIFTPIFPDGIESFTVTDSKDNVVAIISKSEIVEKLGYKVIAGTKEKPTTYQEVNELKDNRFVIISSLLCNKRTDTIVTSLDLVQLVNDVAFAEEENEFLPFTTVDGVNIAIRARNIESVTQVKEE